MSVVPLSPAAALESRSKIQSFLPLPGYFHPSRLHPELRGRQLLAGLCVTTQCQTHWCEGGRMGMRDWGRAVCPPALLTAGRAAAGVA